MYLLFERTIACLFEDNMTVIIKIKHFLTSNILAFKLTETNISNK